MTWRRVFLLHVVFVVGILSVVLCSPAAAGSDSIIAAGRWSASGGVYLFKLHSTDPLDPMPSIEGFSQGWVAFSPSGELFVSVSDRDQILRFLVGLDGSVSPNGTIAGHGLRYPTGMAFSSWGELFVANMLTGVISRFTFDDAGTATPNGAFAVGEMVSGLTFSENGELFVGMYRISRVVRFTFDASRLPVRHGEIVVPPSAGQNLVHDLVFSATGELFVTKCSPGRVYRFVFDGTGAPIPNGYIDVSSVESIAGVAFSPDGELFVSNNHGTGIYRYSFLDSGTAVPSGFTATTQNMNNISIYTPSLLRLTKETVTGCRRGAGSITLPEPAPAAGVTVTLHSDNPHAVVPASVTLKAGATRKNFAIWTSAVAARETATIEASLPEGVDSAVLTLTPMGVKSVTLTPNPVVSGTTVAGLVTLPCPAGPGDIEVALTSTKTYIAEPTTDSILIPVGTQDMSFEVRTTPVFAPVTLAIKATANEVTKSRKLALEPVP
jgi:hypothetical protein